MTEWKNGVTLAALVTSRSVFIQYVLPAPCWRWLTRKKQEPIKQMAARLIQSWSINGTERMVKSSPPTLASRAVFCKSGVMESALPRLVTSLLFLCSLAASARTVLARPAFLENISPSFLVSVSRHSPPQHHSFQWECNRQYRGASLGLGLGL